MVAERLSSEKPPTNMRSSGLQRLSCVLHRLTQRQVWHNERYRHAAGQQLCCSNRSPLGRVTCIASRKSSIHMDTSTRPSRLLVGRDRIRVASLDMDDFDTSLRAAGGDNESMGRRPGVFHNTTISYDHRLTLTGMSIAISNQHRARWRAVCRTSTKHRSQNAGDPGSSRAQVTSHFPREARSALWQRHGRSHAYSQALH